MFLRPFLKSIGILLQLHAVVALIPSRDRVVLVFAHMQWWILYPSGDRVVRVFATGNWQLKRIENLFKGSEWSDRKEEGKWREKERLKTCQCQFIKLFFLQVGQPIFVLFAHMQWGILYPTRERVVRVFAHMQWWILYPPRDRVIRVFASMQWWSLYPK